MSVNEYTTTNSITGFSKTILSGVAAVGFSMSSAFAVPNINATRLTQEKVYCETSSTNNNIDYTGSIKKISEFATISTTIKSFSPYAVNEINFSTVGEAEELMHIIDVYTESIDKDDYKLFEAEGLVLGSLPENYFVRYF